MNTREILNLIDENKLEELGKLYKIDKVNHKITGRFILNSFVSCILKGQAISLRGLETLTNNNKTISCKLNSKDTTKVKTDHSSIGKRLKHIEVGYFKDIYEDLVLSYNKLLYKNRSDKFQRFDSTVITLTGKLLKDGMHVGGKTEDSHIKLSLSLKDSIPSSVRLCKERREISENVALIRAINEAKVSKESILLFDRGITKADIYKELTEREQYFITRVNVGRQYERIKENAIDRQEEGNINIISDEEVKLYSSRYQKVDCKLRLIKLKREEKGDELWFLSNIFYLPAQEVCQSYKKRWEIELFFKFLKQNLQFKKFISYNMQGMSVYLYCVLIAAILFAIFKLTNQLTGFKIALLQFGLAMEKEIIKDIVLFCGGRSGLFIKLCQGRSSFKRFSNIIEKWDKARFQS